MMRNFTALAAAAAASSALLAITTDNLLLVSAFAPPLASSTLPAAVASRRPIIAGKRPSSSSPLSLSPNNIADLSFLLSDAADAVVGAAGDVVADVVAAVADAVPAASDAVASTADPDGGFSPAYSNASYYTTLALYALSFPGLWSQIKRSTKAKVKRKTYVSPGENAKGGKEQRQQAGEIMAYMKANNYEVEEAGETITFRGLVARSTSQAFFLVFCTAIGMASLALVLQIQFQDLVLPGIGSPNWFLLVLLSPYAGLYYWNSGDRVDDMKVKLSTNDDESLNEVTIEGNDEEIERMWRTLDLQEKGMVKVEGILG